MPSSKILVTGGAGYLGSILVPTLLENGFHVTVIDNFIYRQSSLLDICANKRFEVIRGDCRDPSLMKNTIKGKDIIIPLAAIVGAPACDNDRVAAQTTNVDAVRIVANLASRSQMIIIPTTNSGYGIGAKNKLCTEESALRPISFYGKSKVQAEKILMDRGNAISLRLATVFGSSPRMRVDLLVNSFVYRAVYDRAVIIFEGHFKRNYIHVRDVAKAFLHSINQFNKMKGRVYNVGLENANLSKIELCQTIKKIIPSFVFLEAPVGEDLDKRDYIVSNARILATGYKPHWTIEDGVRELIKCFTIMRNSQAGNN
ncbi:MAG: NAD(P)-dependent oxidoreductase [Elusimicrobia bacterium]|nr:NAD(P)-dependent oxidoreductase [Elusimicrobiota bacterium]